MGEKATVIGLFESSEALMTGIAAVKGKQVGLLEAYTPYPIHGIDEELGLRKSPLGAMVMIMGIIGAISAFGFEYWVSAIDYPIVTGGKAPWSWEAFVPIMFEVTVLFATFTAGLGMLFVMNRLPFFGHAVLASEAIKGITRDRFALAVEIANSSGSSGAAEDALREAGAASIEVIHEGAREPWLTSAFVLRTLGGIAAACAMSGGAMYWLIKLFPVLPPMSHMLDQPRPGPQQASHFFADQRSMRMPVPGTISRGHLPIATGAQETASKLANPLPRTHDVLDTGKQKFAERCAVCHGALANGVGSLTAAYGAKPANLQSQQFINYSDGEIFWVITNGKNAMPAHAGDLSVDQRWAVVHYLRALQRAQNAKDEDVGVP